MSHGLKWVPGAAVSCLLVSACASAPPPAAADPQPLSEAPPAPGERPGKPLVSGLPPVPETRVNPPPVMVTDPPPDAPSLASICSAKCDKLVSKCGVPAVESCRVNCTKYEPPPTTCTDATRAALECARDAKDLTCANVAPESCSPKFRAIASCSAGVTEKVEAGPAGLPEGWERVTDAAGYSADLPRGSANIAGAEGPVRSVTAPDGTIYTVSVLPLLKDKPSEKSFLHFLMKVQGRCSDKVKLDGFIEKPGHASIHYKAHCPDKTDWNGMIFVNQKNLFLLSAQAAYGKIGATDPFFYQFELTER